MHNSHSMVTNILCLNCLNDIFMAIEYSDEFFSYTEFVCTYCHNKFIVPAGVTKEK